MPDYSKSKIYRIYSLDDPDVQYIGSTTQILSRRLSKHKTDWKRWKENKRNRCVTSFKILEKGNCRIELIEECPCENREQLHKIEGGYIRQYDCVNKVVPGRSKKEYLKEYYEANKTQLLEDQRDYYTQNRQQIAKRNKAYYRKNKDKRKEMAKTYVKEHSEKVGLYQQQYRKDHKEESKKYFKSRYEANKDRLNAESKVRYEANREQILAKRKAYREANKDRINARSRELRRLKKAKKDQE